MSLATSDPTDIVTTRPNPAVDVAAANASANPPHRGVRLMRRLAWSAAVWALYVPHLAILKVIGPRFGPAWARFIGRLHWLLSFVGAQRSVRKTLAELHPQFHTSLTVSTILRKHLELKHECFARVRVFNRPQDRNRAGDLRWEVDAATAAKFERLNACENGLILVGFHFGFFRLSATVLPDVFPGCDMVHISHRVAHYNGETFDHVAQLALRKAIDADQQSGARIHYVGADASLIRLYRLLAAGGTVGVMADGACARDFMDVPFLGGKLRMPCGWARLAAATHSNVLILADTEIDHRRRRGWLFDHVQFQGDNSQQAVYTALAQTAQILEELVRREPWAWHPWQRIRCQSGDDGSTLLILTELGSRNNAYKACRDYGAFTTATEAWSCT